MAKRKALTALEVARTMGLKPPAKTPDGKDIKYGRKALVGQYAKHYTREGFLHTTGEPPGRHSKGRLARYARDNGTEAVLDLSGVINSRR